MNNRFGFKDFIQIVLLGAVLVLGWLQMVQQDRDRVLQQDMLGKLSAIEKQLSSGRVSAPTRDGGATVAVASRDESWARPGVKIEWQEPWDFASDPRKVPGFQEGGEFTDLFEAQPAKITPFLGSDVYATRVCNRVCDSLGAYDPTTLRFVGTLADAWQQDPEGLWIRVHIRPDARFSDGEQVTAEDVRWTFKDFIFNPSIEAERTRSTLDQIEEVKVLGPKTVEFVFNKALSFNMVAALGNYILPKHFYEKFEPAQLNSSTGLLMGSGPFRLERLDPSAQWSPGQDIVLVRNENHWGPRSPLDKVRFKVVNDDLARLVAYTNGEGDQTLPTSPQFVSKTKEPDWDKNNQSLSWINMRSGYSFIAWNQGPRNGKPTPFGDKRVRQGLTLCLDREQMIRDIWEGIGVVAKGSVNPESPASDPKLKPWPFDPVKGKALLAEAGWKDRNGDGILENEKGEPFRIEFTRASGGEIYERISNFLKSSYSKVGIQVDTKVVDWSIMQEITKSRDYDALMMGWSASAPESDPRQIFHSESIKEGGDNFVQWRSAKADQLIDKIRLTLEYDARMQIWHEFEATLHDEQPYTFIRVAPWLRFVKKTIGNVHPYKTALEPWEFFRYGAQATPGN
jgi:peptide/nickel transport system substrate-binding protein